MNMKTEEQTVSGAIQRPENRFSLFILHVLLPLLALIFGIAITAYLLNTGPRVVPAKRQPSAIVVEVEELIPGPQQTVISAMGEVIAAREVELKPRVSGEIIDISKDFLPGGFFPAGAKILTIDRTDYELLVRQFESDLSRAESDLLLEMGNQRIAEREFQLLGEAVSDQEKGLILRKPQLEKLMAARDYAKSRLDQALLHLERTEIRAPFNGVLNSRMVDTGAKVTETTALAKLVGIDAFWLRLTLPVEQLQWLTIPTGNEEEGSRVLIFPQGSTSPATARRGEVIRLFPSLEEQGRMAQLLVQISDPLSLSEENHGKPPLLLGSYVRAEIEGLTLVSAISVNRSHIHNGNTVWLMDDNGMLDIRPVDITFRGRDSVIIGGGISGGERLVVSALSSPVNGTALRLIDEVTQAGTATDGTGRPDNTTERDDRAQ